MRGFVLSVLLPARFILRCSSPCREGKHNGMSLPGFNWLSLARTRQRWNAQVLIVLSSVSSKKSLGTANAQGSRTGEGTQANEGSGGLFLVAVRSLLLPLALPCFSYFCSCSSYIILPFFKFLLFLLFLPVFMLLLVLFLLLLLLFFYLLLLFSLFFLLLFFSSSCLFARIL